MFFIVYTFKGQVHVFAGRVKIVSHSSCRTSKILKYFCTMHRKSLKLPMSTHSSLETVSSVVLIYIVDPYEIVIACKDSNKQ